MNKKTEKKTVIKKAEASSSKAEASEISIEELLAKKEREYKLKLKSTEAREKAMNQIMPIVLGALAIFMMF